MYKYFCSENKIKQKEHNNNNNLEIGIYKNNKKLIIQRC